MQGLLRLGRGQRLDRPSAGQHRAQRRAGVAAAIAAPVPAASSAPQHRPDLTIASSDHEVADGFAAMASVTPAVRISVFGCIVVSRAPQTDPLTSSFEL